MYTLPDDLLIVPLVVLQALPTDVTVSPPLLNVMPLAAASAADQTDVVVPPPPVPVPITTAPVASIRIAPSNPVTVRAMLTRYTPNNAPFSELFVVAHSVHQTREPLSVNFTAI